MPYTLRNPAAQQISYTLGPHPLGDIYAQSPTYYYPPGFDPAQGTLLNVSIRYDMMRAQLGGFITNFGAAPCVFTMGLSGGMFHQAEFNIATSVGIFETLTQVYPLTETSPTIAGFGTWQLTTQLMSFTGAGVTTTNAGQLAAMTSAFPIQLTVTTLQHISVNQVPGGGGHIESINNDSFIGGGTFTITYTYT